MLNSATIYNWLDDSQQGEKSSRKIIDNAKSNSQSQLHSKDRQGKYQMRNIDEINTSPQKDKAHEVKRQLMIMSHTHLSFSIVDSVYSIQNRYYSYRERPKAASTDVYVHRFMHV